MKNNLEKKTTIITYHYVRELPYTKYPKIKGLLASSFVKQLEYLKRYYSFVTVDDVRNAIYSKSKDLPHNSVLLTFDDGYVDHFKSVFPILLEHGIQGCFFPTTKSILHHDVLDVNQIHFILASANNIDHVINDLKHLLNKYKNEFELENYEYYYNKLSKGPLNYDSKKISFLKSLLQFELPKAVRNKILDILFRKYVTSSKKEFAKELYLNVEQIKCMIKNGMYFGNHSYSHYWMDKLTPEEQSVEIDNSLEFLNTLGAPVHDWVMCFPHGAYNESLLTIIRKKGCSFGLTIEPGIAELSINNSLKLNRLDTNEIPLGKNSDPCLWTKNIYSN